ncbi:MAG: DUF2721 domain-containing protein [Pseudolabrys sp.]
MLKDIITVDQLSLVISQAAAPAFLLGAVASFLSVLVSHMSRIIDRSRAIHAIADGDPMKAQLPVLRFRATLIIRAIHWAVGSGISTCILMIVAFITAYLGARLEPAAAVLFTLSLGLFTASLISFAREHRVALNQNELAWAGSSCLTHH